MFAHSGVALIAIQYAVLTLSTSSGLDVNVLDLAAKHGHPARPFDVITEDGYILQLFHLPGRSVYPVLLMHGLTDTADTWLVRGNTSLAITLANAGYDVWLGNNRGNRYGRRHTRLDPNSDAKFWDFTLHEHGYYDLPAIIDTVLEKTGSRKLNAIGHSQGNTIFYVLGSTRPEYNGKVNLMIAISPVCYLHNTAKLLQSFFDLIPIMNGISNIIKMNEIFGEQNITGRLIRAICSLPKYGYRLCIEHFLFRLAGADPDEFDYKTFKLTHTYFPSSTSRKNVNHFAQIFNGRKFAMFNYGAAGNMAAYNSSNPPSYDLKRVVMPIALLVGLNDNLSSVKDVRILKKQLPNIVNYTIIPHKSFNHMDAIWGLNMGTYLFPTIFDLLQRYS